MGYVAVTAQLKNAFNRLRRRGYFARQNFSCCQSCGCASIPEKHESKYVFYHQQDDEALLQRGECYLSWAGDGDEIVKILREAGLTVEWDNDPNLRIKVKG